MINAPGALHLVELPYNGGILYVNPKKVTAVVQTTGGSTYMRLAGKRKLYLLNMAAHDVVDKLIAAPE